MENLGADHQPVQVSDWADELQSFLVHISVSLGFSFHHKSSSHGEQLWSGYKMLCPGSG